MSAIIIRPANQNEWDSAMDVAWTTFLRYEADEYTSEGVENFWNFITDETLRRMFRLGEYKVYVAVEENRVIGMISLRDQTHISLLFVEDKYHRQGIGSELVKAVRDYVKEDLKEHVLTVNASPYGVPFYLACGFTKVTEQLIKSGIKYTPMRLDF